MQIQSRGEPLFLLLMVACELRTILNRHPSLIILKASDDVLVNMDER